MTYVERHRPVKDVRTLPAMLTVEQYRAAVGNNISTVTICRMCRDGELRASKQGGKWLIDKTNLPMEEKPTQSQLDRVEKKLDILLEKIGV